MKTFFVSCVGLMEDYEHLKKIIHEKFILENLNF